MKRLFSVALAMTFVLCVSSCLREPGPVSFPMIDSGEVDILHGPAKGHSMLLSLDEIILLSDWLRAHQDRWHNTALPAPSPKAVIILRLADGSQTSLEVFESCVSCGGWDKTVRIASHSWTDGVIQTFSPRDFQLIQNIVEGTDRFWRTPGN